MPISPSDQSLYRAIGERVFAVRTALGMTQQKMAEKVGIDTSFYGQIERGAGIMSLKTLFTIADVGGVNPADLLPRNDGDIEATAAAISALGSLVDTMKPRRRRILLRAARHLAAVLD